MGEKADLLQQRRFMKSVPTGKWSLEVRLFRTGGTVKFKGPDDEVTEAVLLTARMFIQDNDVLSLRNLAENWLMDPGISEELRDRVASARAHLQSDLDGWGVAVNDKIVTHRELLDAFLYGVHGHTSAKHAARIRQSRRELPPPFPEMLEPAFKESVRILVTTIIAIGRLIQCELAGTPLPPPLGSL